MGDAEDTVADHGRPGQTSRTAKTTPTTPIAAIAPVLGALPPFDHRLAEPALQVAEQPGVFVRRERGVERPPELRIHR